MKIEDLFIIKNGKTILDDPIFDEPKEGTIHYVRPSNDMFSCISGYIERDHVDAKKIFPKETLIVGTNGEGSHTFSYVFPFEFTANSDVSVLIPRKEMSLTTKLYYSLCITANRPRFSYGRKPKGIKLKQMEIPDSVPDYFIDAIIPNYNNSAGVDKKTHLDLDIKTWKTFRYDEIFVIKKGYYNKKPERTSAIGDIPFIGATRFNNGISEHYSIEDISENDRNGNRSRDELSKKIFKGNCITVTNNGSVGYAFYQIGEFTCSHDVNPLYLINKELNEEIATFLITIIERERYRWSYGRKWRPSRMPDSQICLPIDSTGLPDYNFMEDYIRSIS